MSLIDAVINGETGATARAKINTALASITADGSAILGDGTAGSPISLDTDKYKEAALNQRVINSSLDWPQDATHIILESDTQYIIGMYHTISKPIIPSTSCQITGIGLSSLVLEYTGVGNMFESSSPAILYLDKIRISCPNGTMFNMTGADSFLFLETFNAVGWVNLGILANTSYLANIASYFEGTGQGLQFSGTPEIISVFKSQMQSNSATFKAIDLGTAVSRIIEFDNFEPDGPVGSIGLSGAAASANVPPGITFTVEGSTLGTSGMTPLEGIMEQDIRWSFANNSANVDTSVNMANVYMSGPTEVVEIAGGDQNVFNEVGVPTSATWNLKEGDRFTMDTDGSITYVGERDVRVSIVAAASVAKSGGGSDNLEMQVAKNWTYIAADQNNLGEPDSVAFTDASGPQQLVSSSTLMLSAGDTIRPIFRNRDGTSDIELLVNSIMVIGI